MRLLDDFRPTRRCSTSACPAWTATSLRGACAPTRARAGSCLIALTGYGRDPDRRRALDAGFDEHLVKPVEFEKLLTRLSELLRRDATVAG